MKTLGYYNGRIDEIDRIMVPMSDRACYFGDGVYDAQPCRNRHLFALDEHIERFFNSAQAVRITVPVSRDELKNLLHDLVQKTDSPDLFVYYQVTRAAAERTHTFPEGTANLWVMLKPFQMGDGTKPIQLITLEDTRYFHCNVKTLNLLPSVMAAQRAKEAGCEEAVLYRPGGRVTECAHSNVSILADGRLVTAPTDNLILPGIARAHLLRACHALGIPVSEEPFSLEALAQADEIIVTSSTKLCRRCDRLNGKPAGGKDPERMEALRQYLYEEYLRETD